MADANFESLFNCDVMDSEGTKIGVIGQVYLDDNTGKPSWVTVKTGLFGLKETFVPLGNAVVDNEQVTVPYTQEKIKDAPRVDPDEHLSAEEESELYAYYGLGDVSDADPADSAADQVVAEVAEPVSEETPEAMDAQDYQDVAATVGDPLPADEFGHEQVVLDDEDDAEWPEESAQQADQGTETASRGYDDEQVDPNVVDENRHGDEGLYDEVR